jgi:ATP-dependent protease HslVU (ClpYQ) peptidase subunit
MSVVVAIKDDDKVWMACDSQVSQGYSKMTLTNSNNYKIVRPKNEKNTLVGIVGNLKLQNAMKIQDSFIDELIVLKGEFNFKEMFTKVMPKIFEIAKKYGVSEKAKDQDSVYLNGVIIFAHKDMLFKLDSDGCVTEVDDYIATGSGGRLSTGYLNQLDNTESKRDSIIKAVKAACQTDLYVNYPIIVTNTMDDEFIVINK